MSTPTTNPVAWHEASSYAAAVRAHLDDLAPEVVEELAGGLEADLLDQAEESPDPLGHRLGDPAAYAAELRAAAGVPPRTAPLRRPGLVQAWRANLDENLAGLRRQTWWPQVASVAEQMRPVWWVVRAWVAFQLITSVTGSDGAVPTSFGAWVLLLVLVAGSVALGRGLWSTWSGRPVALRIANAFAVLWLLPALAWSAGPPAPEWGYAATAETPYAETGLVAAGRTVTNVFPYGPDGEPLTGVTLLDQDGEPLSVSSSQMPGDEGYDGSGRLRVQVPNWTADGDVAWNVFPMGTALVRSEDFYSGYYEGDGTPGSGLRPPYRGFDEAATPRPRVPDVLVDPSRSLSSDPSPRASEGAAGTPTTSPVPAPTPEPTPTPTP